MREMRKWLVVLSAYRLRVEAAPLGNSAWEHLAPHFVPHVSWERLQIYFGPVLDKHLCWTYEWMFRKIRRWTSERLETSDNRLLMSFLN